MLRLLFGASLVTLLGAAPLLAQEAGEKAGQPATDNASDSSREIVVKGYRNEVLDRYIEELTATPGHQQIARWNSHICARAIGLDPSHNAFLAGRISEVARKARILVERGKCRPNILVIVTLEADTLVKDLLKRYPKLFGAYGSGRPPTWAVERLLAPSPVRWLNASEWGNADGRPIVEGFNNFIYSGSRLEETTRENATLSLVVVDATKLGGITWGGLSDYLAMVSLARPSPNIEPPSGSTILSLFRNRDAGQKGPVSLTRWDREFLKSLYSTSAKTKASTQRSQIRAQVKRNLSKNEGTEVPKE